MDEKLRAASRSRGEDPVAAAKALLRAGSPLEAVVVLEGVWRESAVSAALFEEILEQLPPRDRLVVAGGLDDLASEGDLAARDLHAKLFSAATRLVGTSEGIRKVRRFLYTEAMTSSDLLIWGESGVGVSLCVEVLHALAGAPSEVRYVNPSVTAPALLDQEIESLEEAPQGTTIYSAYSHAEDIVPDRIDRLREICLRTGSRLVVGGLSGDGWPADLWSCWVPPLRERFEDLPELTTALLARHGVQEDLTQAALAQLRQHGWGGNVRELEHTLRRAIHLREARASVSDALTGGWVI